MVKKYTFWTEEEKNFLRENYLKFGNIELGDILKRTHKAISSRLNIMNLHRPKEWISKRMKKNNPMFNKKTAEKVGLTRKRKYISGELIHPMLGKKRPDTSKRLKENNPMKNLETLEKMRMTINNLYKEGKRKFAIKKGQTLEERYGLEKAKKIKEKLSKSKKGKRTGEENHFYGQHHTKKTRKKIKEKRALQITPMRDTSIEIKIQKFLKKLGIDFFTHQYIKQIKHAYQCDILIPSMNLVIECDGNYWHKYPIGNDLDHIRTKELIEKGFRVLRLWEIDIKSMDLTNFKKKLNYLN